MWLSKASCPFPGLLGHWNVGPVNFSDVIATNIRETRGFPHWKTGVSRTWFMAFLRDEGSAHGTTSIASHLDTVAGNEGAQLTVVALGN